MRLFLALALPDQLKKSLSSFRYRSKGIRWIPSDNLHLTLQFIGEVDSSEYDELIHELSDIHLSKLPLETTHLGHFGKKAPKQLWLGVKLTDALNELHKALQEKILELGLDIETRNFVPHITLARMNHIGIEKLAEIYQTIGTPEKTQFEVSEFHLYSSKLTHEGAIYQIEKSYSLY